MNISTYTTSDWLHKWIFEYADFGIIITDPGLVIVDVNRWILEKSGKEKSELQGISILDVFPEIRERRLDHYLTNALNGASAIVTARFHSYLVRFHSEKDTRAGIMKQTVRITPLLSDDLITGLIIHIEDVTERLNTEEQMQHQNEELQKLNSTKDRFFRIIAHDLRSPFTALLGFSEMLMNDESLKGQTKDIINMLHSSIKDHYAFLENLLKWSQIQTGHFKMEFSDVSLNNVIDHVMRIAEPMIASKNIKVSKEGIPPDQTLYTDRQALTSVLYNLIFNALKFTSPGGRIEIKSIRDQDSTVVFVRDNGIGMSEDKVKKLFRIEEKSPSTPGTNREKGSGLGLILVKELVDKMGGEIWVESIEGTGSTFYVSIPVH